MIVLSQEIYSRFFEHAQFVSSDGQQFCDIFFGNAVHNGDQTTSQNIEVVFADCFGCREIRSARNAIANQVVMSKLQCAINA